jgi:hypothetical protein
MLPAVILNCWAWATCSTVNAKATSRVANLVGVYKLLIMSEVDRRVVAFRKKASYESSQIPDPKVKIGMGTTGYDARRVVGVACSQK